MEALSIQVSIEQNIERFDHEAITKNGYAFDPNLDIWFFNDITNTHRFIFSELHIQHDILFGLKRTFMWYLENYSQRHSINMFTRLKHLLNYLYKLSKNEIDEINSTNLINYKSTLDKHHEWYLGTLSGFLKKWYEMGFAGVSRDAYKYLDEIKLKGNQKGKAVLTMSPHDGPFTDLELESIQSAINNRYANNEIAESDYLLIWLLMIYGSRPVQFALLKVSDIQILKKQDDSSEYIIRIPRAKNRKKHRLEFKERIIPPEIGKILYEYSERIKERFKVVLDNPQDAPLFPSYEQERSGQLAFHQSSENLRTVIQKVIAKFNLVSERTEGNLHITPTRFRRTIGTRAASEGHGELIIAEILDHTDTQNAGVYVQCTPEIIARIDKAVAIYMAPLAQAFAGVLIADKSTAKRFDDSTGDIIDPRSDISCKPIGKCGSYGFCGLLSPLACYTCSSFQAWTDGAHEKLLVRLLQERENLLKITDHRIASINDKTILAVAQVVQECRKYKDLDQQELLV